MLLKVRLINFNFFFGIMTSIAIRIINCDNKIALDWTFIDLDQSFLSYKDLVQNIFK